MDPVLGVVTMFASAFAPAGWAFCHGQLLPIGDYTALFSLLGTTYGGDGQTTFALPDFRGRMPVGTGQGPGLANIDLGEAAGNPNHTLIITEMPAHTHNATAAIGAGSNSGSLSNPTGNVYGVQNTSIFAPASSANGTLGGTTATVNIAGGSQPFNKMMPFIAVNYIIAIEGIYPSRN
jgi:microcystin-dependent protein